MFWYERPASSLLPIGGWATRQPNLQPTMPHHPSLLLRHDEGQCCTSHPSPRHKTVNTLQPGTKTIGAASQPHRALDLSQAHVFKRPQVQGGSLTLVWCGATRRLTSTADGTSDPSNISQPLFLVSFPSSLLQYTPQHGWFDKVPAARRHRAAGLASLRSSCFRCG
jgi:hypothetical protein